jgi:hypothetical protein
VAVIRESLRDAVIEIHRSRNIVDAVVSAFLSESQSQPIVTGDMVYKPLAAKVALIAGLRRALPVFR